MLLQLKHQCIAFFPFFVIIYDTNNNNKKRVKVTSIELSPLRK